MTGMSSWGSVPGYQATGAGFTPADYSSLATWGGPATSMPVDTAALGGFTNVNTVAAPSAWGGISNWLDSSGILGKKMADGTQVQGWGGLGLSAASGLLNGWMGMQQLGVAKDTLAANKEQFAKNYAAQQKTTNAALSDRQAARVASNPGAYQSVGDYMKANGI